MGHYSPAVTADRAHMLQTVGINSTDELFASVPTSMRVAALQLPEGLSEMAVSQHMQALARQNTVFSSIFRGAGAYHHYIPAIVSAVTTKEEFVTAYTPYQPEISQGLLQSIFEFQTMMCELTGLDVANASVYDGASAAAEAVAMCRDGRRNTVLVSATTPPMVLQTIQTYCFGTGANVSVIPAQQGRTDSEALAALLTKDVACVYLQQVNYYGQIEDVTAVAQAIHAVGAKLIMGINPIAAAVLPSAGECGADIAVGEGQPLGLPLSFGGPYLGFMTATQAMMRKLPGRIVGQTTDVDGKRAFVLTLQAREQHIRREKASSNVCSNQALCALTANVYLTEMGTEGLQAVASACHSKAQYAATAITRLAGFSLVYTGEFFHEFVTTIPCAADILLRRLEAEGILGGYPVPEGLLWCVTEMCTKQQIDTLCAILEEVCPA